MVPYTIYFEMLVVDTSSSFLKTSEMSAVASNEWDKSSLLAFLEPLGMGKTASEEVADKLLRAGYLTETLLLAATDEDIKEISLPIPALRVLLNYCNAKMQDRMVDIELKYKKSTSNLQMRKSLVSLETLSSAVTLAWREFEVAGFKLTANAVALSGDTVYSELKFPLQVTVVNLSKGFSTFKEDEAYAYARVNSATTDANEFPQPVDILVDSEWFQHALKDLRIKHELFGALTEGCEYTRREFISAVIILSAKVAGVKLAVEKNIQGRLGNGPVDWVARYESYRICITEGKKDNLSNGMIQNIAQLAATREDRNPKRKFSPSIPSYGIATTYHEWVFLKLTDEPRELFRSTDDSIIISQADLEGSLKAVVGQIVGIFLEQKRHIDTPPGRSNSKKIKAGEEQC